jgi:hypothetical protein
VAGEVAIRRTEVPASFKEQMHMATVLADSSLLPGHLRGKPANVLVILQGARALDVSAFWALQSMHVIEGKLSMAAELMRALVIRAGHKIRVVERSMTRAVVEIKRSDSDTPYRAEFTWEDAKVAGLENKTNWKAYRKSMLVARATSIAVRDECADVMFGVAYTPEELGAVTDGDENPIPDGAGNITIDGEAVEPLTDAEVSELSETLTQVELETLPAVWTLVAERAAQFRKVPGTDESLTDFLAARLAIELEGCTTKGHVRELWDLANVLRLGDVTVTVAGQEYDLRSLMREKGTLLPDDEPEVETVEAEVINDEAAATIDTEHAQQLRAQAAESWNETAERLRSDRKKVLDDLAEQRIRQEETRRQEQTSAD